MKTLAEHHFSSDTLLGVSIVAGLAFGGVLGLLIGIAAGNIGVGTSIGSIAGLIVGLTTGVILSDREE